MFNERNLELAYSKGRIVYGNLPPGWAHVHKGWSDHLVPDHGEWEVIIVATGNQAGDFYYHFVYVEVDGMVHASGVFCDHDGDDLSRMQRHLNRFLKRLDFLTSYSVGDRQR